MRFTRNISFTGNFYITIGKHTTYRLAGKPLIHNGRKP